MILELIIALLCGVTAGTFTGLFPGIHINLVSVILLSISASILDIFPPFILVIFIVSMTITHTFVDFIPSIFLGAPDEDSFLSILPGHRLLLKGHGHSAVILTLYGSLTALAIIILFTPIFIYLLPIIYPYINRIIPLILLTAASFLIFSEKNKINGIIIFLLAGFLGFSVLNLNLNEPLLPLLTGLFGSGSIIISLKQKTKIPVQKIIPLKNIRLNKKSFFKTTFTSILASPLTAFLPSLGASQSATIGSSIIKLNEKEFLFLLGAINTIVAGLSIITFYSIDKKRTGSVVAIAKLVHSLNFKEIIILLLVIIVSGIISFFVTILVSKLIAKNLNKINYTKLSTLILALLIILVIFFSGFLGLLVFIISTFLGISTIILETKRTLLMGCLMIPTILYYFL